MSANIDYCSISVIHKHYENIHDEDWVVLQNFRLEFFFQLRPASVVRLINRLSVGYLVRTNTIGP